MMQNVLDEASATAQMSPFKLVTIYQDHFGRANWEAGSLPFSQKEPIEIVRNRYLGWGHVEL